ncbi:MAG: glutathione-dependent formaldehyde dehydrogenase [Deltaproteobacteria bacterium]|nr:glutathione-dependent formaldehyde dehydrogenase [Deltaproteobacteria bacterium]
MRAICWHGKGDVRCDKVPDPEIKDQTDVIVRITSTAICGSDLHLYDGFMKGMEEGDIIGHEPMGEVVEVGKAVKKLKTGDRVVVPFPISCGDCFFCSKELFSLCDRSNPNADAARELLGQSPAGLFGYSHLLGGYPGGQAEYLRVPYADVGPLKIESGLPDDKVLFLSDIFPTGYMAADNAEIEEGDTVAVWGCGPVGQFTIQSAWMFGAGRVIAIDCVPERLRMAEQYGKAETVNFEENDVYDVLMEKTKGRGPDRCIDAVGAEAHAASALKGAIDRVKTATMIETDRPHVLREAIMCCRKGGTLSVPGVYTGIVDSIPMGAVMNKALTVKSGQTHVQHYYRELLEMIEDGSIDPSFVITHRVGLEEAPEAYNKFRDKEDGCIKVVINP